MQHNCTVRATPWVAQQQRGRGQACSMVTYTIKILICVSVKNGMNGIWYVCHGGEACGFALPSVCSP